MKQLAKQRRLAAISQHELARRADVKFSRLHYAESGRLKLTAEETSRIERVIKAVLALRAEQIAVVMESVLA